MINNTSFGHLIAAVVQLYKADPRMPGLNFDDLPITFNMNTRMRTTGGICISNTIHKTVEIRLNSQLFATLTDGERSKIIAHELAHGVAFFLGYKDEGHGDRWRRIARAMGDTGERCHTLKVTKNKIKRQVYAHKDNGKIYTLSIQKSRKLGFNIRGVLEYVGEVEVDRNTTTYRWSQLHINDLRSVKIFNSDFKLLA